MKTISKAFLFLCFVLCSGIASAAVQTNCKIEFLGSHFAERSTDAHLYVYQFDLWKCDSKLFGFYYFTGGLQGDLPAPSTKSLFVGSIDNGKIVISDWINFSGHIDGKLLTGTFNKNTKVNFSLGQINESTKVNGAKSFKDYADWEHWAQQDAETYKKKNCVPPNCSSG